MDRIKALENAIKVLAEERTQDGPEFYRDYMDIVTAIGALVRVVHRRRLSSEPKRGGYTHGKRRADQF